MATEMTQEELDALGLDEDEDEGTGDGEENEDEGGEGDEEEGDEGQDDALVDRIVAGLSDKLDSMVEKAMDRRINGVLKEIRGQGKKTPAAPPRRESKDDRVQEPAVSAGDAKLARVFARQELQSTVRFADTDERDRAMALVPSIVAGLIAAGDETDPDEIGRTAAEMVKKAIVPTRTGAKKRTVQTLRAQGSLPARPGAPARSKTTSTASRMARGRDRAKRFNERNKT